MDSYTMSYLIPVTALAYAKAVIREAFAAENRRQRQALLVPSCQPGFEGWWEIDPYFAGYARVERRISYRLARNGHRYGIKKIEEQVFYFCPLCGQETEDRLSSCPCGHEDFPEERKVEKVRPLTPPVRLRIFWDRPSGYVPEGRFREVSDSSWQEVFCQDVEGAAQKRGHNFDIRYNASRRLAAVRQLYNNSTSSDFELFEAEEI